MNKRVKKSKENSSTVHRVAVLEVFQETVPKTSVEDGPL